MSTPRTQAARTKRALVLAKKLEAAAEAMLKFTQACVADGDRHPEADDGRTTLTRNMLEFSGYLESVYDKPAVPDWR